MFILLPLSEAGLPKDMEEKNRLSAPSLPKQKMRACKGGCVCGRIGQYRWREPRSRFRRRGNHPLLQEELGVASMCGLSNISFGLPERSFVNAAFLAFAIQAGITAAIVNPAQRLLMNMAAASDLLRGKEEADIRYIDRVTGKPMTLVETAYLEELKENAEKMRGCRKDWTQQKEQRKMQAVIWEKPGK